MDSLPHNEVLQSVLTESFANGSLNFEPPKVVPPPPLFFEKDEVWNAFRMIQKVLRKKRITTNIGTRKKKQRKKENERKKMKTKQNNTKQNTNQIKLNQKTKTENN